MRRFLAIFAASFLLWPQSALAQAVGNGSVSTVNANQSSAISGNSYYAGPAPYTNIGINNALNITISDGAGSGKYCLVTEWHTSSTATLGAGYMSFIYNPTTNLPTTTVPVANELIGSSNTSVCTMKSNVGTAMSGGVTTTSEGLPQTLQGETFVVYPGTTFGIMTPASGLAINATESFYWRDVPLGGF